MDKVNKLYLNNITYVIVMITILVSLLLNIKTDVTHMHSVTLNDSNIPWVCGVEDKFNGEQIILIESKKYKIDIVLTTGNCFSLEEVKAIDFSETNYIEIIEQNNNLMAYILDNLI